MMDPPTVWIPGALKVNATVSFFKFSLFYRLLLTSHISYFQPAPPPPSTPPTPPTPAPHWKNHGQQFLCDCIYNLQLAAFDVSLQEMKNGGIGTKQLRRGGEVRNWEGGHNVLIATDRMIRAAAAIRSLICQLLSPWLTLIFPGANNLSRWQHCEDPGMLFCVIFFSNSAVNKKNGGGVCTSLSSLLSLMSNGMWLKWVANTCGQRLRGGDRKSRRWSPSGYPHPPFSSTKYFLDIVEKYA